MKHSVNTIISHVLLIQPFIGLLDCRLKLLIINLTISPLNLFDDRLISSILVLFRNQLTSTLVLLSLVSFLDLAGILGLVSRRMVSI